MLTHSHFPSDFIDLRWQRPVLPDGSPTLNPVESPISRRLLHDLQLAPNDRLLAIGTRDPQFLELAAADVGRHGHVTVVEPDPDRFQRARRRTVHLRDVVVIVHELSRLVHDRYDAVAVVAREGVVPDLDALRFPVDRLRGKRPARRRRVRSAGRPSRIVRTRATDSQAPPVFGGPRQSEPRQQQWSTTRADQPYPSAREEGVMNHPTLPLPLMISSALSAQDLDSVHSPAISARRRALLMRRRDDPAP